MPCRAPLLLLALLLLATASLAQTSTPTATPTPGADNACCDIGGLTCVAPVDGTCSAGVVLYESSCVNEGAPCVTQTPSFTPTQTPTPTETPTTTPTNTPTQTPTSTPCGVATYTVDNNGDAGDATPGDCLCATAGAVCTLRAALEETNAHAGGDTIVFAAAYDISISDELHATKTVTIDGTTAPGAVIGDIWAGTPPAPVIHITTNRTAGPLGGLGISGPNSIVQGLWLTGDYGVEESGNESAGIQADGTSDGSIIRYNRIETFALGVQIQAGGDTVTVASNWLHDSTDEGVLTQGGSNTTIEDNLCQAARTYGCLTTRSDGTIIRHNIVVSNLTDGIVTEQDPDTSATPTTVTIIRNRVGVTAAGAAAGNSGAGINLKHGSAVTIGGATGADRNIVSASLGAGVNINAGVLTTTVQNNYVGTDATGANSPTYCNLVPQIADAGTGTTDTGNTINNDCTAGPCCAFTGAAPFQCLDAGVGLGTFTTLEECQTLVTGVGGTATYVNPDVYCSVRGDATSECYTPLPTGSPTVTPTETATPTNTPTASPTPTSTARSGCCASDIGQNASRPTPDTEICPADHTFVPGDVLYP